VLLPAACAVTGGGAVRAGGADARVVLHLEQQFAAMSRSQGARAAFLDFLDADAIVLQPGPVWGRAAWESAGDLQGTLDWTPDWAGMAGDGVLGFASGPWLLTPAGDQPPIEGRYLTVWRRGAAGWRVIFDGGFGRAATEARPLADRPVRLDNPRCEHGPPALAGELQVLDAMLSGAADRPHGQRVLARLAADAVLFHAPVVEGFRDDAAWRQALQALPASTQLWPMGAAIAATGDFGYTYGLSAPAADAAADASYAHIWCRAGGGWRLLLQLRRPLPAR
jgi:ketosteroid isomerase-like protein